MRKYKSNPIAHPGLTIYTKPTDKHQYLLHSSCHPKQTKRAIPFSLALTLRRICSTDETFTFRANELMTYLHKRGYNRYFRRQEITRAKNITRNEALLPKSATTTTSEKPECVLFILTYNPALRSTSSIIRKLQYFNLIPSSPQHVQVCTCCCLPTHQQPHQLSCTS